MKRHLSCISIFAVLLVVAVVANGQLRLPRPSQGASVTQTIGVTDITINYSRPAVKGRAIFGDVSDKDNYVKGEATLDDQYKRPKDMVIVPNGHVWRAGANEATQFVVTDDNGSVVIELDSRTILAADLFLSADDDSLYN